jgi:hypothetical protein
MTLMVMVVVAVAMIVIVIVIVGLVGVTGAIEAGVIADQSPVATVNVALPGAVWVAGMVMPRMSMLMAVATVAVLGVRIAIHCDEYKSFGLAHCV